MAEGGNKSVPFSMALIAGGCAGTSVDVALFPIDTIKTRCQTKEGFFASGGFRGVYRGLAAAAAGSAPGAALFFSTYETVKPLLQSHVLGDNPVAVQGAAASSGEVVACLVRVPTEVVKQRMQAGQFSSLREAATTILKKDGALGFYRGYFTTVAREIPFSLIQFPLWERMKKELSAWQGRPYSPWQGALCGSLAGGFSAAVTTPLDVAKTRQMLGQSSGGLVKTLGGLYAEGGIPSLFSGVAPRTFWISLGGFVFFGAYEKSMQLMPLTGLWD
jgi:solute carrier family 25 S-adenosylmethionine transporter 26